MNEVEKMYENAGVKKGIIPCPANYYGYDCTKNNQDDEDCSCDTEGYPLFTAEKQIELIKWLMCKKQTIQVELRLYESDFCISHITECEDNDTVEYVETGRKNTFDEALADLINELWQSLTDAECTQIKEILSE